MKGAPLLVLWQVLDRLGCTRVQMDKEEVGNFAEVVMNASMLELVSW